MKLWQALEKLKENGPINPDYGICSNADELWDDEFADAYDEICSVSHLWPSFSGEPSYPVEGQDNYEYDVFRDALWENPKRYEFLDWLIDYFKQLDV